MSGRASTGATRLFSGCLATSLGVLALAGSACAYDVERRFCSGEAFHADLAPPPIVLGCRLRGCCPGCDENAPVALRVDVEGGLPLHLKGRIDGGASALGGAASATNFGPGRTQLAGVASSGSPSILRIETSLDAAAVMQAGRALVPRPFEGGEVAHVAVTFTQTVGDDVVAVDRFVARASACPVQQPLSDRIEIDGNDGNDDAVVLVRGARAGACVSGEVWRGKRIVYVGNLDSMTDCPSDVAVFSRGHAALLRDLGGIDGVLPGGKAAAVRDNDRTAPAVRGDRTAPAVRDDKRTAPAVRDDRTAPARSSAPAPPPAIVAGRELGPEGWTSARGERLTLALASSRAALSVSLVVIAAPEQIEDLAARARFDLGVADRALDRARCGITFAVADGPIAGPKPEPQTGPEPAPRLEAAPADGAAYQELLSAALAPEGERCVRVDSVLARREPRGDVTANLLTRVVYIGNAPLAAFACREQALVVVGALAQPESLAHGLGHLLGLGHRGESATARPAGTAASQGAQAAASAPAQVVQEDGSAARLGSDNLMDDQAGARIAFTLGQCFVAAFDPRSILNRPPHGSARAGAVRTCDGAAAADSCPPIGLDVEPELRL